MLTDQLNLLSTTLARLGDQLKDQLNLLNQLRWANLLGLKLVCLTCCPLCSCPLLHLDLLKIWNGPEDHYLHQEQPVPGLATICRSNERTSCQNGQYWNRNHSHKMLRFITLLVGWIGLGGKKTWQPALVYASLVPLVGCGDRRVYLWSSLTSAPSPIINTSWSIIMAHTPVFHHLIFGVLWYFLVRSRKFVKATGRRQENQLPVDRTNQAAPVINMSPLRLSNECQCSSPGEKELASNYSSGLRVLSIVRLPCCIASMHKESIC